MLLWLLKRYHQWCLNSNKTIFLSHLLKTDLLIILSNNEFEYSGSIFNSFDVAINNPRIVPTKSKLDIQMKMMKDGLFFEQELFSSMLILCLSLTLLKSIKDLLSINSINFIIVILRIWKATNGIEKNKTFFSIIKSLLHQLTKRFLICSSLQWIFFPSQQLMLKALIGLCCTFSFKETYFPSSL